MIDEARIEDQPKTDHRVACRGLTTLKLLNIDDSIASSIANDDEPAAVRFEAMNIDNCLTERHPALALNVIELRVALAMCFLEAREANDRL